jgi:hypothetical protein
MIPLSIGELTISKFHEFIKVAKSGKTTDLITLFEGLTIEQIDSLPLDKLRMLNHRIGFLLSDYNDMLNGVNKYRVKKFLFVKGRLLKAVVKTDKLNTNQYTALKTFNFESQLNDICSVCYTPLKGFDKSKVSDISEAFKDVKVKKVYGLVFFYSNELKKQKAALQASLIQAKLNLMEQLIAAQVPQEVLDKVMAGITL